MKDFEEKLQNAAQELRLAADEKALIRERLVTYMSYKPIRASVPVARAHASRAQGAWSFFRVHHLSGALVIALVVTTGTFGVSFAATSALPGDLLYPVKVNVNEELQGAFLTSNEARMTWERERAVRRLDEASQLASQGRLDPERQQEVTRLFAEHTEAAVSSVRAVEKTDPVLAAEASNDLEQSLGTHEEVLARMIVAQDDTVDDSARALVEQVHTAATEAGKIREDAEQKIAIDETDTGGVPAGGEATTTATTTSSGADASSANAADKTGSANLQERAAYRAQVRTQQSLADAEKAIAAADPSSDLAQGATEQVASGKELMAEGDSALASHDLGAAYGYYRRAGAAFQKVAELLQVAGLFSIDIYPDAMPDAGIGSTTDDAIDDASTTPATDASTTEATEAEETAAQAAAEAGIKAVQARLLGQEGYDPATAAQANSLIKDASANVLRGEIARVLEETHTALQLFAKAQQLADRAADALDRAAREGDVHDVTVPADPEATTTTGEATDTPEEPLTVYDTYTAGAHNYTGAVTVPSTCTTIKPGATLRQGLVSQRVALELTTHPNTKGSNCTTTPTTQEFKLLVASPRDAQLTQVKLDGVDLPFVVVPGTYDAGAAAATTSDETTEHIDTTG